ncbi:MAG TPA: response regulator [Gemmatimonadales bacterium]|nr:response regulator [Gemmatimonadales bacterium]
MADRLPVDADQEGRLFRLLIENAIDYCIFTTDPAGIVRTWNPGAERMLQYTAEELRGRTADVIFTPEDRQAGGPELERELALRLGRAENERWHMRKDGTRFWGAGIMLPLRDGDGAHLGFAKILRDFTRRRELEIALRRQERTESLGVLVGGVAHLFNNLHTVLIGNLELLARRPSLRQDQGAGELLGEMRRASERTTEITRNLLQYAGQSFMQAQAVDPCREFEALATRVQSQLSSRVRLTINVPDVCPPVHGDPTLLQQLFAQLVLNAAEAMGQAGGAIMLSARPDVLSAETVSRPEIAPFDLRPGRYVTFEVRDNGPGMDAATRARIFEPFFTTRFQGRGLGLAASLGIVRTHGGAITVTSAPGEGTAVRVMLPERSTTRAAHAEGATAELPGQTPARPFALVCDDEELVRNVAVAVLESEGLTVVQAENGEQAIKVVQRVGAELSVVLLDLAMPVMDGEEAVPHLRALRPDLPIVVMTGLGDLDARARLTRLGLDSFLSKPFTIERLVAAVRAALEASPRR